MGKVEFGVKRICAACGARFYDLHRQPIVCPKCGVTHEPQAAMKTRRGRATPPPEKAPPKPPKELPIEAELEEVAADDDLGKTERAPNKEDEQDVIEDPAELGQDDADVAEVIEKVDKEER